jgi:lipoprotein NlpI
MVHRTFTGGSLLVPVDRIGVKDIGILLADGSGKIADCLTQVLVQAYPPFPQQAAQSSFQAHSHPLGSVPGVHLPATVARSPESTPPARRHLMPSRSSLIVTILLGVLLLGGHDALIQGEEPAAQADVNHWLTEGERLFFAADPAAAALAFDHLIALSPAAAPQLWQRGIALFYSGRFIDGRKQFELHQTVNPNDVENAAWHFLCVARSEDLAAARAALIPIAGDARVPMREIHALFAGSGTAEDVLAAAEADHPSPADRRDRLCYAHLYLGLYEEALGHVELARQSLVLAAVDYRMDHYMGRVAQVHIQLRGWTR